MSEADEEASVSASELPEISHAKCREAQATLIDLLDLEELDQDLYLGGKAKPGGSNMTWLRTPGPVPDDPFLQQCILAYATDFSLIETMLRQHKLSGRMDGLTTASLDHAVWFHAPMRIDGWLFYVQESPVTGGARGYARGSIFTQDGRLVASAVQEGLMRVMSAPESGD
jgi:acyl-CoA thioesterase-2